MENFKNCSKTPVFACKMVKVCTGWQIASLLEYKDCAIFFAEPSTAFDKGKPSENWRRKAMGLKRKRNDRQAAENVSMILASLWTTTGSDF